MKQHKDMLPVRLGQFKTNDEALADTDYTDLIGKDLMGSEIDKIIIDRETARIKAYYEGINHPDAEMKANEYYKDAMQRVYDN